MNEIFSNFENIIILYAPTVLLYLTQFIDWTVTLKKFKALDVHKQVAPVLEQIKETNKHIKELKGEVNKFMEEKADLVSQISYLKTIYEYQSKQIKETNEYLKTLSHENIELKVALRRKLECAVKEPESV